MPHPEEAALVQSLSEPARGFMQRAVTASPFDLDAANHAVSAVAFANRLVPASELTPDQRALATILAHRDDVGRVGALPTHAYWRRRWLGLEPPGVLERVTREGGMVWQRIQREKPSAMPPKFLWDLRLSLRDRLEVTWDVACDAYALGFTHTDTMKWGTLGDIAEQESILDTDDTDDAPNELGVLATKVLDEAARAKQAGRKARVLAGEDWQWPFFKALLEFGIPMKPEWESLLPMPPKSTHAFPDGRNQTLWRRFLERIPAERQAPALVSAVDLSVWVGIELLDLYPSTELTLHLLASAEEAEYPMKKLRTELKALAKKHPAVAEALAA